MLVCLSLIGCSDESESAPGSGGAAGSGGSAGGGGSAGSGGSPGGGGSAGGGGTGAGTGGSDAGSDAASGGNGGGKPDGGNSKCTLDKDCKLFASYCSTSPCVCLALQPGEADPKCGGTTVNCLKDPCEGKVAVCGSGGTCKVQ